MLILCPLHSITSPAVGLGYLRAHVQAEGYSAPLVDLNIGLKQHLASRGTSQGLLEWIFPYGERTFGGEALLSFACFGTSPEEMISRARARGNRPLLDLLRKLNLREQIEAAEAAGVVEKIRSFLSAWSAQIAGTCSEWVGLSVVATNQSVVIYLAQRIKNLAPSKRIVLGGPHFHSENAAAWIKSIPAVEAVIIGDARASLVRWLQKNHVENDPQIVSRDYLEKRPAIATSREGQSRWPFADWSGIDWSRYSNVLDETEQGGRPDEAKISAIPVLGARGCSYNKCTFCYEVLLAPIRQERPIEDVVSEILVHERKFGCHDYFFTDLDFNSDYDRTLELCAALRREVPEIRFHCWLRAHALDVRMLESLYDAGCRAWFVGIEALVDHPLGLMKKGYDGFHARSVIQGMSYFAARRPDVKYGFNLLPGYPGETLDDVVETFQHIASDIPLYRGRVASLYDFALTANTIAWRQRGQLGIKNLVGWNEIQLPYPLCDTLPSFRYWHELEDPDAEKRELIWDHIRFLVGHPPRYLQAT